MSKLRAALKAIAERANDAAQEADENSREHEALIVIRDEALAALAASR